jgi:hypothetical protein
MIMKIPSTPGSKTPKNGSNEEVLSSVQYMMFVDALQAEMHRKYDLIPRQKAFNQDNQPQLKKLAQVFLWIKSKN